MNRLLFVVRSFSGSGAQPIRFRQIISYLVPEFDVHVLEFTHSRGGIRNKNGITMHSLEYSGIGKILNKQAATGNNSSDSVKGNGKPLLLIKRFVRSLLFPDSLITEALRLKREALRLATELKCEAVTVSAFPFTTLICLKALKQKPGIKTILDVGDPFYKNSKNGYIRDLFARMFEKRYLKYTDILVVTNTLTRDHYLNSFQESLRPDQVRIIPMGVSEAFLSAVRRSNNEEKAPGDKSQFNLFYAGQLYRRMREPFELYRAVTEIRKDNTLPKVRLDMYGSFNKGFVAGFENTGSVFFHGHIRHEDLPEIYRKADAIVFIDNAYGMQTPGKIFEIALIGKPVLFISDHKQSPAFEVIKDLDQFVVTGNKSEMIISAIRQVIGEVTGNRQPLFHASDFLWEARAEQYKQILTETLTGQDT
jgi:glycosyltransferase involved in cell wall biosynthesis